MSALQSQVGGQHYLKLAIQPAEYSTRNGLGHMAGDAITYITRYKDKNGKEDLLKAIHSIELLIQFEYPEDTRDWKYHYDGESKVIFRLKDGDWNPEARFLDQGKWDRFSGTAGCATSLPEISEAEARKLVEQAGGVW